MCLTNGVTAVAAKLNPVTCLNRFYHVLLFLSYRFKYRKCDNELRKRCCSDAGIQQMEDQTVH